MQQCSGSSRAVHWIVVAVRRPFPKGLRTIDMALLLVEIPELAAFERVVVLISELNAPWVE